MTTTEMEKMIEYHDKRVKEIWELIAATSKQQKETDRQIKETDERLSASIKETDERLSASIKETDEQIKENDARLSASIEKTDKKLTAKIHEITDQWGRFVENFLVPGIPKVFQEKKIPIHGTSTRVKRRLGGENMEIDVLAINAEYAILVEAKNVLKADYVKKHLQKLARFKEFFPEYRDKKILGAVAAIEFATDSDTYATSEGLFVITLGGDTVRIANEPGFKPREW